MVKNLVLYLSGLFLLISSIFYVNTEVLAASKETIVPIGLDSQSAFLGPDNVKPLTMEAVINLGHSGTITALVFNPDGKLALSGSDDSMLKLWDVNTGLLIRSFIGHMGKVTSIGFSPDGKCALSGSEDETLKLWDVNTGNLIRTFKGHTGWVKSVAFSNNGKMILSGSKDKTLKLWDVKKGNLVKTFKGHEGGVISVAFNADGKTARSTGEDNTLRLWDIGTGNEIKSFKGETNFFSSMAISRDGRFALLSMDKTIKVINIKTGTEIRTIEDHTSSTRSVTLSPDGSKILSVNNSNVLKLWDLSTGILLKTFVGHTDLINSVSFSPDGRFISSGSNDKSVRLWETNTGNEITAFKGHTGPVHNVIFSPDGRKILSGSNDETNLRLWDVISGGLLRTFHGYPFWHVAFSPDSKKLLLESDDNTLKLWDLDKGKVIRILKGHSSFIKCVAFSPYGNFIIAGNEEDALVLWNANTGKKINTFIGHTDSVNSVTFSHDEKFVISGGEDKSVILWDANTGKKIKSFLGHTDSVSSVAFSPDGKFVISRSEDKTVILWDVSTGLLAKKISWDPIYLGDLIAFSPDGKKALIPSSNDDGKTLLLWDVSTGKTLRELKGHEYVVTNVSFSPDGKLALSGSRDRTIKLWDLNTGKEIRTFKGHSLSNDTLAAISSDGKKILSGGFDNALRLWDLNTGNEIMTFSGDSDFVAYSAFHPMSKLALGGVERSWKLWDINTGSLIRTFSWAGSGITFSQDGKLAAGLNNGLLRLWDVNNKNMDWKNFKDIKVGIKTDFREFHFAFGLNGKSAFLTDKDGTWSVSENKYIFLGYTVRALDISTGEMTIKFKFPREVTNLTLSPDGELAFSTNDEGLIKIWDVGMGKEISTLRDRTILENTKTFNRGWINTKTLTFDPERKIVFSGSYNGSIKFWDITTGIAVKTLTGHKDSVDSLALSPDGRRILSASNNTIKLWDVETGDLIRTFIEHFDDIRFVAFSFDGKLCFSSSSRTIKIWDIDTGAEIVAMRSFPEGEWITYTPDGYYNVSPEGSRLINWVTKQGTDIFSFEQFESKFKRPDIIRARLSGDLNAGKPAPEMTIPPRVEMPDHMAIKETDNTTYPLLLYVSSAKKILSVRVFVNGKPVKEAVINAKGKNLSFDVPLYPGANRITAIAYDEKGFSSNPRYVDVHSTVKNSVKPNLYIMAVGISNYPILASQWQLDYAHTDAQAIIRSFKDREGGMFGQVRANLLINNQATTRKIKEALEGLSTIGSNDVVVLFLAGHGVQAGDGIFYFLTPEGSFDNPKSGGLSWAELGDKLSRIKGRVILFIDSCHSGSVVAETVVPNDELARQFFSNGKGGIMVFSASKGRQSSLESPDLGGGFGVFSYGLVQGLGEKAKEVDINKNGYIEFMELVNFVTKYVDRETKGEQTPWLSRKELFGDLPIAKVK